MPCDVQLTGLAFYPLLIQLSYRASRTHHRFPQIQFEYQDPSANFDHARVKGPVVRLLRVKEREAATALEVTAGGRVSG